MSNTRSEGGAQRADHITAPHGALTWRSAAERNRRLRDWRRAVAITFAEQPRCLRIAWAIEHLFNVKTGYCNASNTYLASETALTPRNVQKALAALETDGAIVRGVTVQSGGQRWRAIYPATSILAVGVTSTVDVGGHVHQADVQNLRKNPRVPKSEWERARLAATLRENNAHRDRSPTDGLSDGVHAALAVTRPPPSKQRH
jgi:hypothetical protein